MILTKFQHLRTVIHVMMHNGIARRIFHYIHISKASNQLCKILHYGTWMAWISKKVFYLLYRKCVNLLYLKILKLLCCYFSFFSTSRAISLRRWKGSVNGGLYCNHIYRKSLTRTKCPDINVYRDLLVFNISVGISPVQFPLSHPL